MTNMTKDYYKILDIPEFSTQEEIKSAYRKLARKWHPDIAGNCSDVISKFKEINEAYEVLSNIVRKEEYDRARKFYNYNSSRKNAKKNTTNPNTEKEPTDNKHKEKSKKSFSFDWEEFLVKKRREEQYKTRKEKKENSPIKGNDINTDIEISIEEALDGSLKIINMLQTTVCPKCGGHKFINSSFCSHCGGKGEISTHKKFSVKIPAGIKNNSKIRLAGEGEKGINGGENGDLYLIVHITGNKNFKTDGLNILKNVQIAPYEAVLGTFTKVETPKGEVTVKISPNTHNNQKIRLSGCGINQGNKTGDMIITLEISIPQTLTEEEVNLYKKLKEIHENTVHKY